MKTQSFIRKGFFILTALCLSMGVQSCLDDDDNNLSLSHYYANALVTVKQSADNTPYLQLDDSTTLRPVNMASSPFGEKEVRALANIELADEAPQENDKAVFINWIDSILTKPMAPNLGEEENNRTYGNDPVEILNDWVTIAEDGYLTLRFATRWGNGQPHFVNLISTKNPDNSYEVEFRHNAFGDTEGKMGDALVAFKLDELTDTQGETVKLKLKWNSFSGEKSAEFDYCTRKATNPQAQEVTAIRCTKKVK